MSNELAATSTALLARPRGPTPKSRKLSRAFGRTARTIAAAAREGWRAPVISTARPESLRYAARAVRRTARTFSKIHGIDVVRNRPTILPTALYVANHVSYLDPFVIAERVPLLAVAKHELAHWPVVGRIANAHGLVFVDRHDDASRVRTLRIVEEVLASGTSVLNFPEGTTTTGDRMRAFQRGIFGIARRLRVPVVPVHVAYEDNELTWTGGAAFVPHYLRFAQRRRTRAFVTTGQPLDPRHFETAQALANFARWRVESLAVISGAMQEEIP